MSSESPPSATHPSRNKKHLASLLASVLVSFLAAIAFLGMPWFSQASRPASSEFLLVSTSCERTEIDYVFEAHRSRMTTHVTLVTTIVPPSTKIRAGMRSPNADEQLATSALIAQFEPCLARDHSTPPMEATVYGFPSRFCAIAPEFSFGEQPRPAELKIAWTPLTLTFLSASLGVLGVLLSVQLGIHHIRRYYRKSKRQCVACGYPLHQLRHCPECGPGEISRTNP